MGEEQTVGCTSWRVIAPCCVLVAVIAISLVAPAWASAVQVHALDPVLSLTGGTGVSSLDPVPDPGGAHPSKPFDNPCGVATDAYGDVYVASAPNEGDGAIYVFGPDGRFVSEVPSKQRSCGIAVDSSGRIYAYQGGSFEIVRYNPTAYEPEAASIEYDPEPTLVASSGERLIAGMALDPSNDHLYVSYANFESRFRFEDLTAGSNFTEEQFGDPNSIAVWGQNHDIVSSGDPWTPDYDPFTVLVSVLDGVTHEVKVTLDGKSSPAGSFAFNFGRAGIAVDQANGDIYVDDTSVHHVVDQFDSLGNYRDQISLSGSGLKQSEPFSAIAVDRGEHSPNQGYVFVTSGNKASNAHLYAFALVDVGPSEVKGARAEDIGETEAVLGADLNPHGAATTYRFEYGPGDCGASSCESIPVSPASGGSGGGFHPVAVPVVGLQPGTTYHFRVVATSNCNPNEPGQVCTVASPDATFTTFPAPIPLACPNAALRIGASATLPDCRAYELVTPSDTNGRIPTSTVFGTGPTVSAPVLSVAADGESVLFGAEGGSLPGNEGSGLYDVYRATRGAMGWGTAFSGLNGQQAAEPYPVTASDNTARTAWLVLGDKGSLAVPGGAASYLRGPEGAIEPVGQGSLATAAGAQTRWISPAGERVVFTAVTRLETDAPPTGTQTVYERSPGGTTRVVSLLPGNFTPLANEDAAFLGAATDASAVAFRIGNAIYERLGDGKTVKVTAGPATFGGISADGARVFYVTAGNVFSFDSVAGTSVPIGSGGESTLVNVAASGARAYFVSPLVLTGAQANSEGAKAVSGAENLYVWEAGSGVLRFVAAVTEEDVVGEEPPTGGADGLIGGLGLWTSDAVTPDQSRFVGVANDPSRTTSDGHVLVFE